METHNYWQRTDIVRLALLLSVALAVGTMALAACGGGDDQQQSAAQTEQQQDQQQAVATAAQAQQQEQFMVAELSDLEGEIVVDGSSTVFPITEAVAEEFGILTERDVRVTVGVSGTGGGFKRFCAGETDISGASRPIKSSEIELCAENGIDFIRVPIAFDGLTVVINPDNDWVDFLTVEELNHIFRPDDFAISWADVPRRLPRRRDRPLRARRRQRHLRLLHRGDQQRQRRPPLGQHDLLRGRQRSRPGSLG